MLLVIFDTLSWLSVIEMVLGSFCGQLLGPLAIGPYGLPQYSSTSALVGYDLLLLQSNTPWLILRTVLLILLAFASLVYFFSWLAGAASHSFECLRYRELVVCPG